MLALPIYLRGSTYYFHTRIAGRQFKRSLGTSDKKTAILQALTLYSAIMSSHKQSIKLPSVATSYQVDLRQGILKADGPEDHQRLLEALQALSVASIPTLNQSPPAPEGGALKRPAPSSLRLSELVDKFFLLKKHLKQATELSYRNIAADFAGFIGDRGIQDINISTVTRYLEFVALKNGARTLNNKAAVLNTLFSFAIAQGYYFGENPAKNRKLMPKSAMSSGGYAIFQPDEIERIYQSPFLADAKIKDKDYYWSLILGLFTGCRISEITGLTSKQIKEAPSGVCFISVEDSKTKAGIREIPLPPSIGMGLKEFANGKKGQIFKYKMRLGKGSGNAVGKKFARHLELAGVTRDKLVFHSLRKFTNDSFLKAGVPIEPRCQYLGHELENVNVSTYSQKFTVDELARIVKEAQQQLAKLAGVPFDN